MLLAMFIMLFLLLVGHAIADFALQSDAMAKGKNRHNKSEPPPGAKPQVCWYYWLTAHALIHGGVVWLVTGLWIFGLMETIAHWLIDFGKCENWYGIHEDQLMHLLCKLFYILILAVVMFL